MHNLVFCVKNKKTKTDKTFDQTDTFHSTVVNR